MTGRFVDGSETLAQLRVCKSAWEADQLRSAGQRTTTVMNALATAADAGLTARELAVQLHRDAIKLGSGPMHHPFVAVGPATTRAHATWTDNNEKAGPYLFEFATTSDEGYAVPLCRSKPVHSDGERALSAIASGLNDVAQLKPGDSALEIDARLRSALERGGFSLRHRPGYSIGLGETETWMEGRVARLGPSANFELRPGMAFHVVAGYREPGEFGVGQSRSLLVTETELETLAA